MLTVQDLNAAIAECLAEDHPTKSTCVYLAAFQAVKDQFFSDKQEPRLQGAVIPSPQLDSKSEFAGAYAKDPEKALKVADELIDTLSITHPALYRGVIRKLQDI